MPFLLGGARPLGSAWLGFFLLLWTSLATSGGELCRSWASGVENPDGAFQCPARPDGAHAKFCCGTCSAPYCCSSEMARLDQKRCPAVQAAKAITTTPQPGTTPAPAYRLPKWIIITVTAVGIVLFVATSYGIRYGLRFAYRLYRHWWEARNQDRFNFPLPLIPFSSLLHRLPSPFERPPPYCQDPPPYSVEDPHGPRIPRFARVGHANAGYQDNEAQPGSRHPSEPDLGIRDSSPSWAHILDPSPSVVEESRRTRPRRSASAGCGPPRCNGAEESCSARPRRSASVGHAPTRSNHASSLDCGDPPRRSDGSRARSSARGSPRVWLMNLRAAPPRCSATDSPTFAPEDSPPDSVAVSCGVEVLPHVSDSPPVVQFQPATPGAAKDEGTTGSPPTLLDTSAGGPILEPTMEADKQDLTSTRL